MEKIFDDKTRVIIVAIENYRFDKISKVKYAINDAEGFKDVLIDNFGISKSNIKTFYDSDASKTALEDDIKYEINNLNADERFIFYYVGHGFHEGNSNKISVFDTSPVNYSDTTISLRETLIDPLGKSKCKRSLIFLDTCSKFIADSSLSRDSISNIKQDEFNSLIRNSEYCATFLSCSPGEKSYSDDNLKHGIWTFHLLSALRGKEGTSLINQKYITDTSLRDFLRRSVPKFIVENTDITGTQTPTAHIKAASSFLIYEVPPRPEQPDLKAEFPKLPIELNDPKIYFQEYFHVAKGRGFKSSHFAPTAHSKRSEEYIQNAFLDNVGEELQTVYQGAKDVFNLRRKEITKDNQSGNGQLNNAIFNFDIKVTQAEHNPAFAKFSREIELLDKDNTLLSQIDDVFPYHFNKIFFNCPLEEKDYDDIVNQFENLADRDNGRLEDDDRMHLISYYTIDGLILKLKFNLNKGLILTERDFSLMSFIKKSELLLDMISVKMEDQKEKEKSA